MRMSSFTALQVGQGGEGRPGSLLLADGLKNHSMRKGNARTHSNDCHGKAAQVGRRGSRQLMRCNDASQA